MAQIGTVATNTLHLVPRASLAEQQQTVQPQTQNVPAPAYQVQISIQAADLWEAQQWATNWENFSNSYDATSPTAPTVGGILYDQIQAYFDKGNGLWEEIPGQPGLYHAKDQALSEKMLQMSIYAGLRDGMNPKDTLTEGIFPKNTEERKTVAQIEKELRAQALLRCNEIAQEEGWSEKNFATLEDFLKAGGQKAYDIYSQTLAEAVKVPDLAAQYKDSKALSNDALKLLQRLSERTDKAVVCDYNSALQPNTLDRNVADYYHGYGIGINEGSNIRALGSGLVEFMADYSQHQDIWEGLVNGDYDSLGALDKALRDAGDDAAANDLRQRVRGNAVDTDSLRESMENAIFSNMLTNRKSFSLDSINEEMKSMRNAATAAVTTEMIEKRRQEIEAERDQDVSSLYAHSFRTKDNSDLYRPSSKIFFPQNPLLRETIQTDIGSEETVNANDKSAASSTNVNQSVVFAANNKEVKKSEESVSPPEQYHDLYKRIETLRQQLETLQAGAMPESMKRIAASRLQMEIRNLQTQASLSQKIMNEPK